jgi:hypothetical protein
MNTGPHRPRIAGSELCATSTTSTPELRKYLERPAPKEPVPSTPTRVKVPKLAKNPAS